MKGTTISRKTRLAHSSQLLSAMARALSLPQIRPPSMTVPALSLSAAKRSLSSTAVAVKYWQGSSARQMLQSILSISRWHLRRPFPSLLNVPVCRKKTSPFGSSTKPLLLSLKQMSRSVMAKLLNAVANIHRSLDLKRPKSIFSAAPSPWDTHWVAPAPGS